MTSSMAVPVSKNGSVKSVKGPMHGFDQHIEVTLPPLSTIYFSVPAARKKAGKPAKAETAEAAQTRKGSQACGHQNCRPQKAHSQTPWQQNRLLKSPERQKQPSPKHR